MSDIQNTAEVAKGETVATPVVDAPTTEEVAAPALAVEDKPAEETQAAEATETKAEEKPAEEIKPVEEGHLGHKAQGASFPKNLIPSKEFFFFGTEALEPKVLAAYLRSEKNTEQAHHNVSWASHTGSGLLFVGDKAAPTNVINLADTTEPETDGSNKFHFTHKGAKHSFKAATPAERDSWVAQLKTKIAEAKELAATVTESEAYKNALESLKPVVKEETPVEEAKAEEAPKVDETAATEGDAAAATTAEDKPAEDAKRRSASRKRASIFGFGRKESAKKDETPAAEADAVVPAAEPAAEALKAEETPAAEGEAATAEDKAVEEEKVETPKPAASKRNSFFGAVFSKKEKKTTDVKPTEEVANEAEATTDAAAPVIPPVESTTPINADEVNAAGDNTEAAADAATKKDVKEKRKSSLPFAFGRREKSPSPVEGEEKRQTQSPFSKLRATIKSKTGGRAEEKPAEDAVKEETDAAEAAAPAITEEPAVAEPAQAAEAEAENKSENVATSTPAVTAAA